MSDTSFTSTRLMAQSAGLKANQAYALARDALAKIGAFSAPTEEPDYDHVFDEFDRRLKAVAAIVAGFDARLAALEARKPGRPSKT